MNYLYLDIETIPTQLPEIQDHIVSSIKPPATMKKAETIAAWEQNDKDRAVQDAIDKTSLDGAYGHICCIGFAINDSGTGSVILSDYSTQDEALIIREFFSSVDTLTQNNRSPICVVGHNVINFDIRFIWQRAIILGVHVPHWFPRDPKPWSNDVFDTMTAFAGQRGTISLDRLCKVMGIKGKDGVDGSMVAQMWRDGKHDEIAQYCRDDVRRVRSIHKRMMVAYGDAS